MKRVRIEVPATSANLGPGFDCLGMALDLCDTVYVDLDADKSDVRLAKTSGTDIPIDETKNLLCRAYKSWQADTGTTLPGARFVLESHIPMGRGLGSSAAAIVAGLSAAAFAVEDKDPLQRILRLATTLEGHSDNVTAAAMGGVTVSFRHDDDVVAIHVANHLSIGVALYVPDEPLETAQTRAALPTSIPMSAAVFDLGRLAFLVTALQWGQWDRIGPAMQDQVHQPYRATMIPGLHDVIAAATEAGAYGAALSGAGPSVVALGPVEHVHKFAAAMESAANDRHWPGRSITTGVRRWGAVAKEVETT